jgi:PAS domain S-box-containing protein
MYVREGNDGSLGHLLDGLELDEEYLLDPNNWVSHSFLHILYHRMIDILGDENAVYKMALASERFQSLGLLNHIARLIGNPKFIYAQAPKYNRLLKLNGDVHIHELGDSWVLLEDRYHDSVQKTRYDCDYTRGILVGIPTIFGMPPAHVEEIECQVAPETYDQRKWADKPTQGCRGCLYRVQWDTRGMAPLWKRLFARRTIYRRAIEDLQEANRRIQEKYDEVRKLAADLESANKQLILSKEQLESKTADLQASERRHRLLAENVTDIIWTFSLETMRFTYISPSVEMIRGFTPNEAMELSLERTLAPQSLEIAKKALAEELAKDGDEGVDPNRSRTMEVQQLCKNGSYAWAEATMTFIRDDEGRPVGVLGITRDISERKRAEEQRAQPEAILVQAQKMESLGTLAGGVAHNFNNILMGIQGRTSLMLVGMASSHPHFEHLKGIEECVKSATDLTGQILGFARSGKYVVKPTDMKGLLTEAPRCLVEPGKRS